MVDSILLHGICYIRRVLFDKRRRIAHRYTVSCDGKHRQVIGAVPKRIRIFYRNTQLFTDCQDACPFGTAACGKL